MGLYNFIVLAIPNYFWKNLILIILISKLQGKNENIFKTWYQHFLQIFQMSDEL